MGALKVCQLFPITVCESKEGIEQKTSGGGGVQKPIEKPSWNGGGCYNIKKGDQIHINTQSCSGVHILLVYRLLQPNQLV